MKTTILTFLFFTMLTQAYSQPLLTFQDAIVEGLENNFDIKIAKNIVRIAENNITRGNAGFLPNVTWSGSRSFSRQNVKQEFISGTINDRSGATSNTWNTGVNLNWTLFDGMGMFRTYDKLKAFKELEDLELRINMENTVLDIALGYYNIILQENSVQVLDTSLNLSQKRIDIAQARYEEGKSPRNEYLSAQVDYNTDFSALVRQKESLEIAKNNLNELLGREANVVYSVPLEIPLDTTLELQDLKENTLRSNSLLENARMTGEILQLEVKEIKAESWPVVGINVAYSFNDLSSQAGFLLSNRTNGLNYGLTASWSLFEGSNRKRRRQNTIIEIENNDLRIKQLELELMHDLENTFLSYKTNQELIRLEQKNLEIALDNANIAVDRYQLGKSTFLELREAQLNVIRTLSRSLNAIYSAKIDELNLLRISGKIIAI